jgi:hypothetical protein
MPKGHHRHLLKNQKKGDSLSKKRLPFHPRVLIITIIILLIAGTLAIFWPVRQFDFINFDDHHVADEAG